MTSFITRFDPFRELVRMQDEMGPLFGRALAAPRSANNEYLPEMDVAETKHAYLVRMDLPGVDPKDASVTLHDNRLTVKGEKRVDREEKEKTFHRVERVVGTFVRSIELPGMLDESKIQATFRKGVLEIDVPKGAQQKTREIPVNAG